MKNHSKTSLAVGFCCSLIFVGLCHGESLDVETGDYVEPGSKNPPKIGKVFVKFGDRITGLEPRNDNPRVYTKIKDKIKQELGLKITEPYKVEISAELVGGNGFIRIRPETIVTLDRGRGNTTISVRCYDVPTYYGVLIDEAKRYKLRATEQQGMDREKSLKGFFKAMEEASLVVGRTDPGYVAVYREGLCQLVGTEACSEYAKKLVGDWFQSACLDWKPEYAYSPEIQLSNLIDSIARASDPSWRPWACSSLLKSAYDIGRSPDYGHNSLCDKLIQGGEYELAIQLTFLELDRMIIEEAEYGQNMKNWFGRATSAIRKIEEKDENLAELMKRVESRESNAKRQEKAFLENLKVDLDVIKAGG